MKQILSMTSLILLGTLAILLLSGVECNDTSEDENPPSDPEEKCGDYKYLVNIWYTEISVGMELLNPEANFSSVQDGWAYYSFHLGPVEDICAHQHVWGTYEILYDRTYAQDVRFEAEVMYGVLFTHPITKWEMFSSDISFTRKANYEFGMKYPYGDSKGYAFPYLSVGIKNQGFEEDNHRFLKELIWNIKLEFNYYKWKDNSGGG